MTWRVATGPMLPDESVAVPESVYVVVPVEGTVRSAVAVVPVMVAATEAPPFAWNVAETRSAWLRQAARIWKPEAAESASSAGPTLLFVGWVKLHVGAVRSTRMVANA